MGSPSESEEFVGSGAKEGADGGDDY